MSREEKEIGKEINFYEIAHGVIFICVVARELFVLSHFIFKLLIGKYSKCLMKFLQSINRIAKFFFAS